MIAPGAGTSRIQASYVLPIRRDTPMVENEQVELTEYLRRLTGHLEVIVVDGSPPDVYELHHQTWGALLCHVPMDQERATPNGKVGNVLEGVRHASHDRIVIADDDVRYTLTDLRRIINLLGQAEVIRPQNYFQPAPWHARWDMARSLLNRMTGGDWPGTLAVRRAVLRATGGYDGTVMFENLELVRTIRAVGGREHVALDLYVRRLPPAASHFWSQRTRQAYDELARPGRLAVWLSVVPVLIGLVLRRQWGVLAASALGIMALAEMGRRRSDGGRVFPVASTCLAPAWVLERGVCAWLAIGARALYGGIPYRGRVLRRAATPMAELRRRHQGVLWSHTQRSPAGEVERAESLAR